MANMKLCTFIYSWFFIYTKARVRAQDLTKKTEYKPQTHTVCFIRHQDRNKCFFVKAEENLKHPGRTHIRHKKSKRNLAEEAFKPGVKIFL